jgi:hypothetical protein
LLKRKNADPDLIAGVQDLLGRDEITTTDIGFLLEDLHEAGFLVVLMLDEFEWVVRTDAENVATTRDFLGGLRALINYVPRVLSLIVATRQPLDEVCRDVRFMGSPFYNNFVFVHLRPFSQNEAELLLQQMLANTGLSFSQTEKDLIYGLAGTHPLLLQVAAGLVFESKISGASQIHDLFPIREQFRNLVNHQFEDFWKWSQSRMQQILTYLASGRGAEATTWLEAWARERETLIRRGLIVKRRGKYCLFSPVFEEWLAENFYRLGVAQWLDEVDIAGVQVPIITPNVPPALFVSYSHQDEAEKDALLVQLGVLQQGAGLIDVWSDDRIQGGEDWEQEISEAMERAEVAILLVSANFLTSDFILGKEVPKLLRRRESEGLVVVPVIAKHCAWREIKWLAKLNVRPKNGNPVWREDGAYADEELSAIAEEIADIMKRI